MTARGVSKSVWVNAVTPLLPLWEKGGSRA